MGFKSFNADEFKKHIDGLAMTRSIKLVQLHHTYSPSYKHFNGSNHETLQKNMKNYHVNTNGWSDLGQHFTIFPDGVIVTGRSMNSSPAGIKGANTGAVCIECLGNFDKGGDEMTEAQKNAIVAAVRILADRFKLDVSNDVIYHAWYSADGRDLGDYVKGHSAKTCPGTNFFGGNGLTAFRNNLQPLLENYGKEDKNMPENKVYNYLDDTMPDWAKPTITKLVMRGWLKGDSDGKLNLSHDMLRILVINDRAGIYDKE